MLMLAKTRSRSTLVTNEQFDEWLELCAQFRWKLLFHEAKCEPSRNDFRLLERLILEP